MELGLLNLNLDVSKMLLPVFVYLTVIGNIPVLPSRFYLVFSFKCLEFFDRIQCGGSLWAVYPMSHAPIC